MNGMLHEEMKAGALRLSGLHEAARAVQRQAVERSRVLALANAEYGRRLDEVGFQIRQIADRAALYGQPAEPAPASPSTPGAFPGAAVVASQNRGGPIVIDMYTGRTLGHLVPLTT